MKSTRQKKQGNYLVLVRRKGIYQKIAVAPSLEKAFGFGKIKVLTTAAASFKVKALGGREPITPAGKRLLSPRIFYESKREPGTFIQKRRFRISTPGEKREIPGKAQFVNIMKGKKKSIFGKNIFGGKGR